MCKLNIYTTIPVLIVENTKKYMPRRGDMPVTSNAIAAPQVSSKKPSTG